VRNFVCGVESLEDGQRPGRPKDVCTPDVIRMIDQAVKKDPHVSIRTLAKMMKIRYNSVFRVLHKELNLKIVSSKWIPKLLSNDEKKQRVLLCQMMLHQFQDDGDNFVRSIVTQDETPIYFYTPVAKHGAKVWLGSGGCPPEVPRTMPPYRKVTLSIWWDCDGLILTKFYGKGQTMAGMIYSKEIDELRDCLKIKRRGKLSRGVNLLVGQYTHPQGSHCQGSHGQDWTQIT
jgi:hypothetical protein